jgi:hypothetical protein
MTTRALRTVIRLGLIVLAAIGSTGTGSAETPPSGSDSDIQTLRTRAAQFWAARVDGDIQRQWELLEPRGRGRVTAMEYGADRGGLKYLAYQVEDATVKGLFGTVKVKVLFQPVLPPSAASRTVPPQATVTDDSWIRIAGVWYRRLEDAAPPAEARTP